jgi:RNA polymerase sigma-70 factor (ECF subfamily)
MTISDPQPETASGEPVTPVGHAQPEAGPPPPAIDTVHNSSAASETDAAEAELVARFRAGDVTAFETIYRLHHRYVHLQARRVISDMHRAEDIAQEAFLRLTRQLLTTNGEIRLRAWLHRTTTNLAIDEHRRSRTQQHYHEQGSPLEELQRSLERTDHGHPERMAEQSEVRAVIAQVIEHLPPRYRRILALRELEGLDYPSIATAMNLSVSAVESLLFRARRRFTEVYTQVTDEPAPGQRRRHRGTPPAVVSGG